MIQFKNVDFTYTGISASEIGVKDIDISVKTGECILLCGRSGCGKTTITKLINGLIPNYFPGELNGDVQVDDLKVFETPIYQLAQKIGSVFQNPRTQFFNVDVDSEIAFGVENAAIPPEELKRRLENTLEILNIRHLQGRNIFELSGGEKQKVAFASVYAINPDIFLLDEPSSNLDMASIEDLKKYLRILKNEGKTILIAEHRLYYLLDIADRIVYLSEGRIKAIWTPTELRKLSDTERKDMGLRAVTLENVHPVAINIPIQKPVLEIRDVSLFYKKQIIIEHISMRASKGEIIGVVGCNGAGKTTFLRALCGLHRGCTGEYLWQGNVQNEKERMRRSYMVMQDVNYELFADSVEAECTFGIRNTDSALVERTLDELGLLSVRERHPNTLSGGQKQRVAVAVSMVCGKELLVFDEPTSGLDYDSMEQVSKLIQKLAKNKVIFVVTHDYEFVCLTCSRLIRFDQHALVEDLPVCIENKEKIYALMEQEGGKEI